MINFFFEETDEFDVNDLNVEKNIETVLANENRTLGEVNYIFCSDDYLLNINKQYLNHDYYTDVISFDYSEDGIISGDIFISVDTVKDNANEYEVEFKKELARVMVHGVLHFIGYKDKTEEDAKQMRQKENQYLPLFI
ncbi:MAG: rRNA maturation RNase YbeY [Salinivirgaceae bacterium]|nr:rRNA maturation RNase YbeY [Salinivirgaceae bacterium]